MLLLIWIAGLLVPGDVRSEWRDRWRSSVASWRVLRERGELPDHDGPALVRRLFADAFGGRRVLRGPALLVAGGLAALLAIGIFSDGFATSRWLIATARDVQARPNPGVRYDARGDFLFKYIAPVIVAGAVASAMLLLSRRSLRAIGWRSWMLLLFKVVTVEGIACLLWVEGGHALRTQVSRESLRFGVLGVGLAILYIAGLGYATAWCVADQRRRCPVCLHRLVMPVTMGSWASIYDPAATEMVCDQGHGSLALQEAETGAGAPDRWTVLDSTWRELFR